MNATTQIVPFGGTTTVAMPDYFADIFGEATNIPPKMTVPQLSVKGSKFRIIMDGEETVMTRLNPDTNEQEPISLMKLVVLNMGKRAARTYNSKPYDPNNVTPPDCFSLDGEKPDPTASSPQSKTCASCPMSQKGSKISAASGKAITACTMQRRLAVVPASKLNFEPLLLRLAPTSSWDKNNESNEGQGWFAWQQYLDFISARGVKHTAAIVTMVKFDSTAEYPKLLFKPERLLTQEEASQIKDVWNSEKVRALLETKEQDALGSTAADDLHPEPFESSVPIPAEPAPAPAAKAAKTPKAEKAAAPAPAHEAKAESQMSTVGSKLSELLSGW